ncbi:MAG: glutamate synthase subunit beta [Chitinophagales bacterium]
MGKATGFLEVGRKLPEKRNPKERIKDFKEVYKAHTAEFTEEQASRCMDCGVPFCHMGCPLGNNIPEFNDAVYRKEWKKAYDILDTTNNFPEFTGRICPAPCESACVLAINKPAITIEMIEKSIIEMAFKNSWVKPRPPKKRSDKTVAVVGSGPAGLAAADQLNKAGHTVHLYERADRMGGLLRYGIPDFKLEKWVVERRISLMEQEGVVMHPNTNIGEDIEGNELLDQYDAVILSIGSTIPRDLKIPGRSFEGIHFAMDFLTRQNKIVAGDSENNLPEITAKGKDVIVIGGGDTGSDCIGTSNRQGANSIFQIELLNKPPLKRSEDNPWPEYAHVFQVTSSHAEGCERAWSLLTKEFIGDKQGKLKGVKVVDLEWKNNGFEEIEGSERIIPCQLALLAIGYLHPQHEGLLNQLGVELTDRGNVADKNYQTNIDKVFAAGDMRRGQSLVVWAMSEGREAARAVDEFLMEKSELPSKDASYYAM